MGRRLDNPFGMRKEVMGDIDTTTAGTKTLTVAYKDFTKTFEVKVTEKVVEEDKTAPTIESVKALDNKHIEIVFSEEVDRTGVENAANYSLYSYAAASGSDALALSSSMITPVLQPDKKTVIITVINGNAITGFANGGMTNSEYQLYVDQSEADKVQDLAGNAMIKNSNMQFTGTTKAADSTVAAISAKLVKSTKTLTVAFSEPINTTNCDTTKFSLTDGTNTVALKNAATSFTRTSVSFNLSSMSAADFDKVEALTTGSTKLVIADGAYTDVFENKAFGNTVNVDETVLPRVADSAYDEASSTLTVNFTKAIDSSTIDTTQLAVQYSTDGGKNYSALISLNTTDFVVKESASKYTTSIQYELNKAAKDEIQSKRTTKDVVYRIKLSDGAVKDEDGFYNETSGGAGTVATVSYTQETAAPVVTSAKFYTTKIDAVNKVSDEVAANGVVVEFDQNVTLNNDSKFVITYPDGSTEKELVVTNTNTSVGKVVVGSVEKNKLFVTLTAGDTVADKVIAAIKAGKANIKVKEGSTSIQDENKNAAAEQTATVEYVNNAAQGITAASHSSKQIVLTNTTEFKDTTYTTDDFKVYKTSNVNATVELTSVDVIDSNADGVYDAIYLTSKTALSGNYTVEYKNLIDSVGNTIADSKKTFDITADATAPLLKDVTYVDSDNSNSKSVGDKVVLTFDEPVVKNVDKLNDYPFGTGNTLTQGSKSNQLVINVGSNDSIDLDAENTAIPANVAKDITGTKNTAEGKTIKAPAAAAKTKIVSANIMDTTNDGVYSAGDIVTVVFDKDISATDKSTISEADFTASTSLGKISDVTISGSTMTFKLGSGATVTAGNTTLKPAAGNTILNSWSLSADNNQSDAIKINNEDTSSPTLVSAQYVDLGTSGNDAGDLLLLTFSEPINTELTTNITDDFVIDGAETTTKVTQIAGNMLAVALGTNTVNTNSTVQVNGMKTDKVKDATGNSLISSAAVHVSMLEESKIPTSFTITTAGYKLNGLQAGSMVKAIGTVDASAVADANGDAYVVIKPATAYTLT